MDQSVLTHLTNHIEFSLEHFKDLFPRFLSKLDERHGGNFSNNTISWSDLIDAVKAVWKFMDET